MLAAVISIINIFFIYTFVSDLDRPEAFEPSNLPAAAQRACVSAPDGRPGVVGNAMVRLLAERWQ